jgi:hypothetical protein
MQRKIYTIAILILLGSCTRFEDAEITERSTFVHFYSSAADYFGTVAEIDTDGGYILTGEVRKDDGVTDALVIKTDSRGKKLWEKVIPKSVVNAIKPTGNGYILVGDSVQLNPLDGEVHELVNTYARLMLMDGNGNILGQHVTSGSILTRQNNEDVVLNIDYHGQAVTLDPSGNIIMLGSYRIPGRNESSFVAAYDPADISDSTWLMKYESLEHDYINANTVHVTPSSTIAWASKMHTPQQGLSRGFVSIPHVGPNSAPINHSLFGETDSRNHSVEDMQKSPVGYCAIGTYAETSGLNANIYFIRIDGNLNVIPGSVRYIDGEELLLNNRLLEGEQRTTSTSYDEGLAITATSDGFVLASALTGTPLVGNGGKDILLVKLDAFGNLIWKKLIGGTGDEIISSIRETPDKGLLLFGTNTINGLSSMMLIKTDANGEIKD